MSSWSKKQVPGATNKFRSLISMKIPNLLPYCQLGRQHYYKLAELIPIKGNGNS